VISKPRLLTLIFGLALVGPASMGLALSGGQTILHPFPMLTALPALGFGPLAVLVPTALFFTWGADLFQGSKRVPRRSYWLLGTAIVLQIPLFLGDWQYALRSRGVAFIHSVCVINIVWGAVLAVAFALDRLAEPSYFRSLLLHWTLFAWLAWYAFPYLGEFP
jgi:hypothetical protein